MDLRNGQTVQLLASTVLAGVCSFAFEPFPTSDPATLVVSVAWLAMVNSIGAVSLLYLMVRRDHAGRASTMFFLVPSVTAVLATVILHEPLEIPVIAGFSIDAAGVLLVIHDSAGRSWPGRPADHRRSHRAVVQPEEHELVLTSVR
ncbi:DMT family transporter [Amycolatopsis sp. NBC_00355]|uniref:DMT family transporter n=1 Tax=Amycolatopsis sp. NBC_00355 TaxID=2975957 RepID=UPI002E2525A0